MNQVQEPSQRRIVIVGGGTSGWMTAALMARQIPPHVCRITLIEAPGPRGIGVGEASIPSLVSLLQQLGARESDMMRACEATWKLAIRFDGWIRPDSDHWHPFGVCGAKIDGRDLFPWWHAWHTRTGSDVPYNACSIHCLAALAGKGPHARVGNSPITATRSWAWHFNAESLAAWLREQALKSGTEEIRGTVRAAHQDVSGRVEDVILDSGQPVHGDFFVDCSGFRSILMNETLKDRFQSWQPWLLCDRAVAWKIPSSGSDRIPSYTVSKAMPGGWMWQIPLAHHVGLGYVFSSAFVSDEAAWDQFRLALPHLDLSKATPRYLAMRVGRQTSFWKHNVLAVGLSAGFLEPLESTGIHLSQVGVEMFLRLFTMHGDQEATRTFYNRRMSRIYDEVRDFVQLHYTLSQRDDTDFWKAARSAAMTRDLEDRLSLYDETGRIGEVHSEAFPDSSYYHILSGSNRLPQRASAMTESVSTPQLNDLFRAIDEQNRMALGTLWSHEEQLGTIHRPAMQRAS